MVLSTYCKFALCVVFYQLLIASSKCGRITCSVEYFSQKSSFILDGSPNKVACSSAASLLNCGSAHCSNSKVCISDCFWHQETSTQHDRIPQCMVPNNKTLGHATLKVLRSFGWRRALALIDESTSRELYEELGNGTEFEISIDEASTSDVLQNGRHKIIVLVQVDRSTAIKTLCTAYKTRMHYPEYAWITVGINIDRLLDSNIIAENCTVDNIKTVINNSLDIQPTEEELNCALRHVVIPSPYDQRSENSTCSIANLTTPNVTFIEKPINYFNDQKDSVYRTVAVMIQTRVSNGSQVERSLVAGIEQSSTRDYSILYTNCVNHTTLFPDGIPKDGTSKFVMDSTHIYTFIASVALFATLLIFAFWCILFNILYRKRRIVKLTSPTLNYVMIFGTVLLGLGVVLYNIPLYSNQLLILICIARFGAIIFGYDICFGIAMLKLFRVHYIFKNPSKKKKPIKDWHLLTVLGAILIIEVFAFIALEALNFTLTPEYGKEPNRENPVTVNSTGITVYHFILVCGNSLAENVLSGVTVGIKFIMHAIAIVLAIRIRNVKIDVINDAKESQAIVYISTVLIVSLMACSFTLEGFANAYGIGIGICVYLECITFLGLTFIPKMVKFCKDPEGKTLPFISIGNNSQLLPTSPTNKQPPNSPITLNDILSHPVYTIQVSSAT